MSKKIYLYDWFNRNNAEELVVLAQEMINNLKLSENLYCVIAREFNNGELQLVFEYRFEYSKKDTRFSFIFTKEQLEEALDVNSNLFKFIQLQVL